MIKGIKEWLDELNMPNESLWIRNSISTNMSQYIQNRLKEKLHDQMRKGIIICCKRSFFDRYNTEFKKILGNLGYRSIEQPIPINSDPNRYLIQRLKGHLAETSEKSSSTNDKIGINPKGIFIGRDSGKSFKNHYILPDLLIGLIEIYLEKERLMIIISNAEEHMTNKIESVYNDIVSAGDCKDNSAALTLVYTNPIEQHKYWESRDFFIFSPESIANEDDLFLHVWSRLDQKNQQLFNSEQFRHLLIDCNCSAGILNTKWNSFYQKIIKFN